MNFKLRDIVKLVDYDYKVLVCIGEIWGWDTDNAYSYYVPEIPSDLLEMNVFEIFGTQDESVGFLVK